MSGDSILLWLILLPMIGGAVTCMACAGFGRSNPIISRILEVAGITVTLAAAFGIAVGLTVAEASGYCIWLDIPSVCGLGLSFKVDGFRGLYITVSAFAWLTSSVFFFWYGKGEEHILRYHMATMLTMACTLGVLLSADLFTTFVFFEGMSFASYVWVAQEQTPSAIKASKTYLAVAVIGGLVLLMGLFMLNNLAGTLVISELPDAAHKVADRTALYVAGGCMLFGFGAKAGAWPLHIWLPKAHPEAPASASALLSGILTKTGIFGILILSGQIFVSDASWGRIIVAIGVITMLTGALRALTSTDIKHMLACSSVSQIGFIMTGVGAVGAMYNEYGLAVSGSLLHMLNHSCFKLILFLAAGIIVKNVGSRDLNRVSGFGRKRYWMMILVLTASLGIAGIPGFSGYISKTLLHEALVTAHHMTGSPFYTVAEWLFLFAGGCTVAYMIKFFVVIFLRKPSKEVFEAEYRTAGGGAMPKAAMILLSITAAAIFIGGTVPELTMMPVGSHASSITVYPTLEEPVSFFTWENLKGSLISIGIGIVLFFAAVRPLVSRKLKPLSETPEYVDRLERVPGFEEALYRPLLLSILPAVGGTLMRGIELATEGVAKIIFKIAKSILATADKAVDALTLLLRRTALRPVCEKHTISLGEALCLPLGQIGNAFRKLGNATVWRKKPKTGDCIAAVNRARENATESVKLVSRSLSYGLMAFCVGLIVLLVYILMSL